VGDSYEPVPDPPTHADRFSGGDGYDMLWYEGRTQRLRLTADGVPDDGAPGEGDEIDPDVEHLRAGSNDDYIRVSDRRGGSAEGEGGNDTIFAGAIPWGGDGLQGGAGDDRLIGAAGRDSLGGGEGDDTIYGGPRVDYIDAGDGADVIDARDGSTPYVQISPHDDVVDCGRGVDVLHADWGEAAFMFRWDGNGCDHVDAPPEPMFQIRRRSAVEVRDRRARMTVECPSKADGPCVGSVGILVPDAQGSTKPRYGTLFVEGQLVVRPGRRKRVDMRLQPEGAKYLEHHGRPDYGALSMRGLREWRSRKGRVPLHYRTG
jgi:hypothetical protein